MGELKDQTRPDQQNNASKSNHHGRCLLNISAGNDDAGHHVIDEVGTRKLYQKCTIKRGVARASPLENSSTGTNTPALPPPANKDLPLQGL